WAMVLTWLLDGRADAADNQPATPEAVQPVEVNDVNALVAQLADDSYQVREKAMQELWRLGIKALPELRKIADGDDPEASARAEELALYISAGVLYDSPEKIKALVLKFSRSSSEAKLVILRKLMDLGQWRQVLHLAKFEKNPNAREQMNDIVQKTAGRATRDAIAKGDFDLAEEILELTADDAQSLMMRAWFHHCRGNLELQLQQAADIPGKKGAMWRLALHRVSGNIPGAILEAEKAGLQQLADAFRVLEGNPQPWLKRQSGKANLDVIYGMACRIQLSRLEGKDREAALVARELARMARDDDSIARASIALAANGFRKQAIDLIRRQDVESAFEYYDATESPQLSLEVLGIPKNAKPPFTDWVKKFTANAIEEEDDDLYRQLVMLAGFLVAHGEGKHAIAVLTPMMTALESDGSDEWFDLIAIMADYGLGAEAIHFIGKRGNEDGEADLSVRKLLDQIPAKSRDQIWSSLKKRNNQNIDMALRELALLSGLIKDPENETDKLHKALADDVADAGVEDKETRLAALFSFCVKRHDLAMASRMADSLSLVSDRWIRSKNYLDAALLRWKKVEPVLAETVEKSPGSYFSLIKWHIALSKLGHKQKASEAYDRALFLSMGNAEILNRMGWELYEAGFDQKAADLWLQAAAVADPSESDYDRAMVYLAHYGQALYRTDQWQIAASVSEVSTQLMMRGRTSSTVQSILRARFYTDFCHGMVLLKQGNKSAALTKLNAARQLIPGDGSLADEFFPILRKENLGKTYDQWFEDSYRHVEAACKLYPKSHNSHNTAAWLASRAVRKLDAAYAHSQVALKIRPTQGAYLDTMAEVWFARGNRPKAVEWSKKAIAASIAHAQGSPRPESQVIANYKELYKQYERFKNDPFPNK
ncbi:MAG: hypothetical protein KJO79_01670, partial [Verrucomicrobiae bacterium]|nr:hypothetical protein [Verrucomicrobiae bacterium]NNJ85856.1 hypothetical protein [Akkermansiaceae bacterium]